MAAPYQRSRISPLARRMLEVLEASSRPMTMREISEALEVPRDEEFRDAGRQLRRWELIRKVGTTIERDPIYEPRKY